MGAEQQRFELATESCSIATKMEVDTATGTAARGLRGGRESWEVERNVSGCGRDYVLSFVDGGRA